MSEPVLNHIGGQWVPARSGRLLEREDPADPAAPPVPFPDSDETDVAAATASARKFWEDWRRVPPAGRAAALARIPEALEAGAGDFAAHLVRETGLLPAEAAVEVRRAVRAAAAALAGPGGEGSEPRLPTRVPVGVCGVIGSADGAVERLALRITASLAAGNTVVLKPSATAPAAATRLVSCLLAAGVPPLALGLVHGRGATVGAALAAHPDVRLVACAGRTETGRAVALAAAAQLKRTVLALGAQNAMFVAADADLDRATADAARGAFSRAGQFATSTTRIVLHRRAATAFTERFVEAVRAIRVGRPGDPGVEMGPLWTRARRDRTAALIRSAREAGARVLCGGDRPRDLPGGWFLAPTVLGGVTADMAPAQAEVWGPLASLLVVDSLEEGIHVINDSPFPATVSVYTEDRQRALPLLSDATAGVVLFNAPGADLEFPVGPEGYGDSANGRPGGTLDAFTQPYTVVFDDRGRREGAGFEG